MRSRAWGSRWAFHRLLTHRSFETYPAVRYALAALGTLVVEGSVIKWVADHRKHHAFADEHGDPPSPHDAGPGVLGALRGLWHAHVGWLFNSVGQADRRRYAADLLRIAACVGSTPPRSPCSRPAWRSRSSWAS
jgi:stearoyl-CoA desaturase (Delta-9 desaturase)